MNFATYVIDIAALSYLIGLLCTSTSLNIDSKRPFLVGIILTVIIILSEAGTVLTGGRTELRSINILCNVLGFALTPIIPIAITLILDRRILRTQRLLLIPTLVNTIATVSSPRFGFVFYVDANNQYTRGKCFVLFIAVYTVNLLLLIISTLNVGKKYNYPILRKMVGLSLFAIAGTSIQLIEPSAYSSWHCVTLSLFLYFLLMSEFDSSFDTLTGLYNRATFDRAAKQMVRPKAFSIIILDINDFKSVNDTYGHAYGDIVIKTVAAIVRKSFSRRYTCYRFGGDEISIIGNETDQEKIEFHLRTMTNALAEMREKGVRLPTVSYGYSIFTGTEKPDFYRNLKEADDQMYHFKKVHRADGTQKTIR